MAKVRDVATDVHRTTVESSTADIAAFLVDALGSRLVTIMVGARDPKTVTRWVAGERAPRGGSEERLRAIFYIFQLLLTKEGTHTVRAWFVGMNPQLDDESPARVIADGRTRDVLVAAKAFLAGG